MPHMGNGCVGCCSLSLSHSLLWSFSESSPKRMFLCALRSSTPLLKIFGGDHLTYNNSQTDNLMCVSILKHSGEGNASWLMLRPGATGGFSAGGQSWQGRILWLDSDIGLISALLLRKMLNGHRVQLFRRAIPKISMLLKKGNVIEIKAQVQFRQFFFTNNCLSLS